MLMIRFIHSLLILCLFNFIEPFEIDEIQLFDLHLAESMSSQVFPEYFHKLCEVK